MSRKEQLEARILEAREAYYNGVSTVPDAIYDAWVDELTKLDATSKAVTAIGNPPTSTWPKVKHVIPMGSLDKVQTLEEFGDWASRVSRSAVSGITDPAEQELFLVTEKLDGISVSLQYVDGKLTQALTRGDGSVGEDITPNVRKMKGVPDKLSKPVSCVVRGEILLFKEDLAKHFPDKTSTRNVASGTARRLDGAGAEHLTVLCYKMSEGPHFQTEGEQFELLSELGFRVPTWFVTAIVPGTRTPQDLWMEYQQYRREKLPYDIDGLVVTLNDVGYQLSLGVRNGRPLGSIAFKFPPMEKQTVIKAIQVQVGSTGRVTPVAVFDPIHLVGAVVKQASLYNWDYIKELGVGVGARVKVVRANDVIPRVESVVSPGPSVDAPPEVCPSCGTPLEKQGVHYACPNTQGCPAQIVGRLRTWVEKQGVLEWGDALLEAVVTELGVKDISDLYALTEAQLARLPSMGSRSAYIAWANLHKEDLEEGIPLDKLLGGLSIPNIGESTIRLIMDHGFPTWEALAAAQTSDFMKVPGIGAVKARSLRQWISEIGIDYINRLQKAGVRIAKEKQGALTGKSVCFTGSMKRSRAELEKLVEEAGGRVKTSVTKNLTYLVMANPASTSNKAKAARKNGTACISEEDLIKLIHG